ncbi:MAG: GNAT family N-acetyltransferase [Deltaproteobacteria bacterium]|nr:GNAT family N-acetyltransferase [Deltaproteobacteria bacterium]
MPMEIRDADLADPADAAAVVAIVDAYASDPMGGGARLSDEIRTRLVPGLRAHPTALVLLAFLDGRAVGVAVCFVGFSTFRARPLLNVHDLAVVHEARGRGVGRALLAAVEDRARARGCCKLTLEVLEENRPARALYARVGFGDVAGGDSASTRFLAKALDP